MNLFKFVQISASNDREIEKYALERESESTIRGGRRGRILNAASFNFFPGLGKTTKEALLARGKKY